jgi:hypothetical protein
LAAEEVGVSCSLFLLVSARCHARSVFCAAIRSPLAHAGTCRNCNGRNMRFWLLVVRHCLVSVSKATTAEKAKGKDKLKMETIKIEMTYFSLFFPPIHNT